MKNILQTKRETFTLLFLVSIITVLSLFFTKNNLPLIRLILNLCIIYFITLPIKIKSSSCVIIITLTYLTSYLFDVRAEERLSPFNTNPNYEALFFILLIISTKSTVNKKSLTSSLISIAAGSLTALITSFASGFLKKYWKFIFFTLYLYPIILLILANSDFSNILKNINELTASNLLKSYGIPEYKIISLQNRFISQFNHIESTHASGLIGYGRAETINLGLSAHNLFVQNFSQNGLLLYLLLCPLYYMSFKKLNPHAAVSILIFSFTIDIFSFYPMILSIILCKQEKKPY